MKRGLLHHVEINVSDLSQSIQFWGWLLEELGYSVYQKWDTGQSWKIADTYLVFVQADKKFIADGFHRRRVGLNHLAFYGESKKQIDEITEKIVAKGIPILYEDKHPYAGGPSHYAVFFEDPDRIKVEVVASVE
ncbi:VOC family protein [Virgibacillus pantothenticus]|uniref:VOC family protein n=1 Tax=Virgibacillus pantothenticus TaxID=1473 RepID=UPI0009862271|nr:VOC family protein [Virgibacillus pantothenticus]